MAAAAGKRIAVTTESASLVSHALQAYADHLSRPREEHPNFTIDVWEEANHLVETMARCSSLLVARAAFDQAAKERIRYKVTLRQGIRVVVHQKGERDGAL